MENSGTALAIRGKDGVVFAVEKIVTSKLYEKGANRRIFNIDTHVGMAAAGLTAHTTQQWIRTGGAWRRDPCGVR